MSYKALLFCPDERTAKTVTQVLSELEFQVEACNEPFAAVKLLMAGHFDAVVVDCDNEQNATLLFKSARNSEFNQASLSVAVVEGQSGVAKAFRIGANLVLTKPINVEQSKGTLRVARGLLRKNEAAKTSAKLPEAPARTPISSPSHSLSAPVVAPKPAFLTHAAPTLAPAAMASSSSAFELEKDPAPEPEPAEAAFLESVSDQANQIHAPEAGASAPKQYPWQPVPKPMAEPMTTALKHAAEATGRSDSGISVGHGAAVAPALDPNFDEEDSHPSSSSAVAVVKPHSAGSSVSWGRIAVIILVAATAGAIYRAGTQLHWQMQPVKALLHQSTNPATPQVAKPTAGIPASATPVSGTSPATGQVQPGTATTIPQNSAQLLTVPGANPQKPSTTETIVLNPATRKPAVPASSFDPPPPPGVVKTIGEGSPDTIMVDTQKPKPAAPRPATETVEPTAPDSVTTDSKSNDTAISGLMSMPAGVAQPGPQTLKVSQGVSQGLLVKKIAPIYPAQAMQAHLQGSVQLLATISKEGNITNVKALSGESVLARAAMDAVRQWKYKPYYLNTEPIEIQTQITVKFTLP